MFCFFFFQAEDGIRDLTVTGVQTCALPICLPKGFKAVGCMGVFHEKDGEQDCTRKRVDRKSTRLNSSHSQISYAVFCLKKKKINHSPAVRHHAHDRTSECRQRSASHQHE